MIKTVQGISDLTILHRYYNKQNFFHFTGWYGFLKLISPDNVNMKDQLSCVKCELEPKIVVNTEM